MCPAWRSLLLQRLGACVGRARTPVFARKPSRPQTRRRSRGYRPAHRGWLPGYLPSRPSYRLDESQTNWLTETIVETSAGLAVVQGCGQLDRVSGSGGLFQQPGHRGFAILRQRFCAENRAAFGDVLKVRLIFFHHHLVLHPTGQWNVAEVEAFLQNHGLLASGGRFVFAEIVALFDAEVL